MFPRRNAANQRNSTMVKLHIVNLRGSVFYRGYDRAGHLRPTRMAENASIHQRFAVWTADHTIAKDELRERIKRTAEKVLPNFVPRGEADNATHSTWWSWADNVMSVTTVSSETVSRNDTLLVQPLFAVPTGPLLSLSSVLCSTRATSENCVLDIMMRDLKMCETAGIDSVKQQILQANHLGPDYDFAVRGVTVDMVAAWARTKPAIQLAVYDPMGRLLCYKPRTVARLARTSLCFVVAHNHAYQGTEILKHRRPYEYVLPAAPTVNSAPVSSAAAMAETTSFVDSSLVTWAKRSWEINYGDEAGEEDMSEADRGAQTVVLLRLFYTKEAAGQAGDIWLDTSNIEYAVSSVYVRETSATSIDGFTRYDNAPDIWLRVLGEHPYGTTLLIPEDTLVPVRHALWQAFESLTITEVEASKHQSNRWVDSKLKCMPVNIVLDDRVVASNKFICNEHAVLLTDTKSLWCKHLGLDAELVQFSFGITIPAITRKFLENHVSIPLALHHPSTIAFWEHLASCAIRGCVQTVTPDMKEHSRLWTVDIRACYLTCLRLMPQAIPVPTYEDVFVHVNMSLAEYTAASPLADDTWYVIKVASVGPPFLGITSVVFASLLRDVMTVDPGRNVQVLYTLKCGAAMPRSDVHKMAESMVVLASGNKDFLKLIVSTFIGSLQRFRQRRNNMKSVLTQDVRQLLQSTQQADLDCPERWPDIVVHRVAIASASDPAVIYDKRVVTSTRVVSTQSMLPIQLAVHNMSYLLLWQLQRALCGVCGSSCIVGYATDSVTFIGSAVGAMPTHESSDDDVRQWLTRSGVLLPDEVAYRLESPEKTRGTAADLKGYVAYNDQQNPTSSRGLTGDFSELLFKDREALLQRMLIVAGAPHAEAVKVARDIRDSARIVGEPAAWTVVRVGDEEVDITRQRLTSLLATQRSFYLEGHGGAGKTYLLSHLVKHLAASTPAVRIRAASVTHDGVSELFRAIQELVPTFEPGAVSTVDAMLRHSAHGFSVVNLECDLLIIDEVSMLSNLHLGYLCGLMEYQPSMKVVFSGDLLQLQNVQDKMSANSLLFKTMASHTRVELTVNRRLLSIPENAPLVAAIAHCRLLLRVVTDTPGMQMEDAVAQYGAPDLSFITVAEDGIRPSLSICHTNHTLRHVNEKQMLSRAAEAPRTVVVDRHAMNPKSQTMYLYPGLHLFVRRTEKKIGLFNKSVYVVEACAGNQITLRWVQGRRLTAVVVGDDATKDLDEPAVGQKRKRVSEQSLSNLMVRYAAAQAKANSTRGTGVRKQAALRVAENLKRRVDEQTVLQGGDAPTMIVPETTSVSTDIIAQHMAPRYCITAYSSQGRTLHPEEYPVVMVHEIHSMDIRSLHVTLGRVRSAEQLVVPNKEWDVHCSDPLCCHRTITGSIYEIQEVETGRVYVGQTVAKDARTRFLEHVAGSCNAPLRAAMDACRARVAEPTEGADPVLTSFLFRVVSTHDVMPTAATGGFAEPAGQSSLNFENPELKYFEMQHIKYLQRKGITLFNVRCDAADDDLN